MEMIYTVGMHVNAIITQMEESIDKLNREYDLEIKRFEKQRKECREEKDIELKRQKYEDLIFMDKRTYINASIETLRNSVNVLREHLHKINEIG